MLTIKHIEDGHESLCTATHVSYYPKGQETEVSESPRAPVLHAFGVGSASVSQDDHNGYSSGTVYVMNERGATVGSYYLS